MGYSDPTNKPWTKDKILELNPKTVLDVGAGQGVYLNMIREILPHTEVTGVEVWMPYVEEFDLYNRYDGLIVADVREIENFKYDLVIFGDVLEHMTQEDALLIWEKVSGQAKNAIISIPIIHYHQDAINGNPYEVHIDEDWNTERVLKTFHGIVEHVEFPVTGVFVAEFK